MAGKKYNKVNIKIKAWTSEEDIDKANGVEVDQKISGNPIVILNTLQGVVAQIMYDAMQEEYIEEAIDTFKQGIFEALKVIKGE